MSDDLDALGLSPVERSFLGKAATPDSAYALLDASPSLEPGQANAQLGVRRSLLLGLLQPLLSEGFRDAVLASRRAGRPVGSAAPPSAAVWLEEPSFDVLFSLPVFVDAAALAFSTADPVGWPPREQNGQGTCIAHATIACIELMRARAGGGAIQRLSTRFLHNRMAARPAVVPKGTPPGYMKFSQVVDVLANLGVCTYETWPDSNDMEEEPTPAALAEALRLRPIEALHRDMKNPEKRPKGVAAMIYRELAAGRPVAIALPGYADPSDPTLPTTWSRADVLASGEVPDPTLIERPVWGTGHAVCVVGFQPGTLGLTNGYFIFRNSHGVDFASHPHFHPDTDPAPRVPGRGYGSISAPNVDLHCWEFLSLALVPGAAG